MCNFDLFKYKHGVKKRGKSRGKGRGSEAMEMVVERPNSGRGWRGEEMSGRKEKGKRKKVIPVAPSHRAM